MTDPRRRLLVQKVVLYGRLRYLCGATLVVAALSFALFGQQLGPPSVLVMVTSAAGLIGSIPQRRRAGRELVTGRARLANAAERQARPADLSDRLRAGSRSGITVVASESHIERVTRTRRRLAFGATAALGAFIALRVATWLVTHNSYSAVLVPYVVLLGMYCGARLSASILQRKALRDWK